ncbi:MAG: glycosyltransferase family 4 protein [Alphaproteobacteria bacterium]
MTGRLHWIVPGPLDQRTGGYIYDRRIVDGLRALGRRVEVHELPGRFPDADEVAVAAARLAADGVGSDPVVIDGLALLAFEDHVDRLPTPWVGLIHHPLAMETGLTQDEVVRFATAEGRLMHRASRLIVTSPGTRRDLAKFDIDPARVSVVLPGVDPAAPARGSGGHGPRQLLTVGSLTRRKGHLTLLDALAGLTDLDWHLNLVGSAAWDPEHAAEIERSVEALDLAERVALIGEQDEAGLARLYDGADLFVLASHHEGYGMVLTEALARALPIVSTTAGAIPETVPEGAGLLVPPGDPEALADALRSVLTDPECHRHLADAAAEARLELQSWEESTRQFAAILDRAIG